eukprot:COSAG02_NODE_59773_length_273_cov_0.597701_1_plen_48_part_10
MEKNGPSPPKAIIDLLQSSKKQFFKDIGKNEDTKPGRRAPSVTRKFKT